METRKQFGAEDGKGKCRIGSGDIGTHEALISVDYPDCPSCKTSSRVGVSHATAEGASRFFCNGCNSLFA